ncbi:MAG: NAD-dependent epimerase/dehydratase family protein [Gemmatimonadales bacterium]|nr:NAD(P)-dependent oxidoreductase [Gemmatimonadales bacterium]
MKALVTGATGFVGSHVVDRLLARGHEITALVRSAERARPLAERGVRLVIGDLGDEAALRAATEGQDVVHHVAALTGAVDEAAFLAANRDGTARLLRAAEAAGSVSRFVHVSSGAAGGPAALGTPKVDAGDDRPVTMYGRSKLAAESVVRDAALPWTILRPPAVYGPRDTANFLTVFRAAKRFGIAPIFGDGSQELSLIHVVDLANACVAAGESAGAVGGLYYVNHPEPVTSRELVTAIGREVGRDLTIVPLPHALTRLALRCTGAWAEFRRQPTILRADKVHEFTAPAWTGDPRPFMADTDWTATYDLARGLADTAAWYRNAGLL